MEAIGAFLAVANKHLPSREVFMTIDLYESQNMAQVGLFPLSWKLFCLTHILLLP